MPYFLGELALKSLWVIWGVFFLAIVIFLTIDLVKKGVKKVVKLVK